MNGRDKKLSELAHRSEAAKPEGETRTGAMETMRRTRLKAMMTGLALMGALALPAAAGDTLEQQHAKQALFRTDHFQGIWEATPEGRLRHVQSGLLCDLKLKNSDYVILKVLDAEKGKDVSCMFDTPRLGRITVFATRLPPGMSAEDFFPVVSESIRLSVEDAKPLPAPAAGRLVDKDLGLDVAPLTSAYQTVYDGRYFNMLTYFGVTNGWAIKVHASIWTPGADEGAARAEALWQESMKSVTRATKGASEGH